MMDGFASQSSMTSNAKLNRRQIQGDVRGQPRTDRMRLPRPDRLRRSARARAPHARWAHAALAACRNSPSSALPTALALRLLRSRAHNRTHRHASRYLPHLTKQRPPPTRQMELLANRIERLRFEERKAKQKVVETKMRGQEIIAIQKRNQELRASKELSRKLEEEQRARESNDLQLKRAQHRAALKETFESMHVSKREEVQVERRVKHENAEMLRQAREYELERARRGRTLIRAHQHVVKERFEKQRQAHQDYLAQDFLNMIGLEDKRREEIELEIVQMELEEHEHIERLRALQEEQKSAYDALEQALAS